MSKFFFISIVLVLVISGFKSNSLNYRLALFDTVPEKNVDSLKSKIKREIPVLDSNAIFTLAEISPSIDQTIWRKHLQAYLPSYIENAAKQNMPAGTYIVQVRFLVEKDGTIKNVEALNDPGYGLKEAAIKVMEASPKWTPAIQNGRVVRCFHKQTITFVVQ
jgi:hypothetical protein